VSLQELETEIGKLALKERAASAKWIVQTLDDLSESELAALWVEEAERRLDELEQGVAPEISAEEALRRARAAISRDEACFVDGMIHLPHTQYYK